MILFGAAETRRVDRDEHLAVEIEANVDAVARRAGNFTDDHAFFVSERVDERAFADIATADDRRFENRLAYLRDLFRHGGQLLHDRVEQFFLATILRVLTAIASPNPSVWNSAVCASSE